VTPSNVRTLRAQLGLTQKALAAALGVAPMTVARWEQGVNPVSPLARTSLTLLAQLHGHSVPAAGRRRGRPSPRRS
jgi:DNA-binding transcriptional regulator YiaG